MDTDPLLLDTIAATVALDARPGEFGPTFANPELRFAVARNNDGNYESTSWERGSGHVRGTFATADSATRALVADLLSSERFHSGLIPLRPLDYAPGFTVHVGEREIRLEWDDEWAVFPRGFRHTEQVILFTWLARGSLQQIWDSLHDPLGAPLFDLAEFATSDRLDDWTAFTENGARPA